LTPAKVADLAEIVTREGDLRTLPTICGTNTQDLDPRLGWLYGFLRISRLVKS